MRSKMETRKKRGARTVPCGAGFGTTRGYVELTISKECAYPRPSLSCNASSRQLIQKTVMRDSVKSFDNIKENNRKMLAAHESIQYIFADAVYLIMRRVAMAEASLSGRDKSRFLQEVSESTLDNTLKHPRHYTRNGDNAVRGRIRTITFLEDGEGLGEFPICGKHPVLPRSILAAETTVAGEWRRNRAGISSSPDAV